MDRCIAQMFGDLCKIHLPGTDQFFGGVDLHMGKIFDDPKRSLFLKQFLELGASDQVVPADLVDGDMIGQICL